MTLLDTLMDGEAIHVLEFGQISTQPDTPYSPSICDTRR